jgi:hypothetical protein
MGNSNCASGSNCTTKSIASNAYVMQIEKSENIIFENNIIHDSWNNDILKVNNYARGVEVRGNIFYNQSANGGDQHIDANVVYDMVVEDNIFFNNYPASGRPLDNAQYPSTLYSGAKATAPSGFVVVKSSVLRMEIQSAVNAIGAKEGKTCYNANGTLMEECLPYFIAEAEKRKDLGSSNITFSRNIFLNYW